MTAPEFERLVCAQRATLLAFARRRARSREDAEDAVQEALAIAFEIRERIRPETALAYIGVTAHHEAVRLRRETGRMDSLDETAPCGASRHELIADPRRPDPDAVLDTLSGLRTLTRDEARALIARMLGWRYWEIADAFGWSYTKTNRCVTEGRAALRTSLRAGEHATAHPASAAWRPDRNAA